MEILISLRVVMLVRFLQTIFTLVLFMTPGNVSAGVSRFPDGAIWLDAVARRRRALEHGAIMPIHAVMPGLVPGIHGLAVGSAFKAVDGRDKPGHDREVDQVQ